MTVKIGNLRQSCLRSAAIVGAVLVAGSVAQASVILDWDPTLSELPPSNYSENLLGFDPANWTTTLSYGSAIKDIYVAAPIHSIAYQPVVEYNAFQGQQSATFSFNSAGVYFSKIVFADQSIADQIEVLFVGAAKATKKKDSESSRPKELIQPFVADCIIVETPAVETGAGAGAIALAAAAISGEVRASNVAEAIKRVEDCYKANGNKPVSVEIVAHGGPGAISVGAGTQATGVAPDAELFDNSAATKSFIEKLKGKISKLTLKGCNVATGVDDPGRDHLMEVLADGLGSSVYAWDQKIYWNAASSKRDGYASIDVHDKEYKVSPVPLPMTASMPFSALVLTGSVRKRGRRQGTPA